LRGLDVLLRGIPATGQTFGKGRPPDLSLRLFAVAGDRRSLDLVVNQAAKFSPSNISFIGEALKDFREK